MRVLTLVDAQNLYYGACSYFKQKEDDDQDIKIKYEDFDSIMTAYMEEVVPELEDEEIEFDKYIYLLQSRANKGVNFFSYLRKAGFHLRIQTVDSRSEDRERGSIPSMIQLDMLEHAPDYDAVLLVSGSGVFQPVFHSLSETWPDIELFLAAFPNTLHSVYLNNDDISIVSLGSEIIKNNGALRVEDD